MKTVQHAEERDRQKRVYYTAYVLKSVAVAMPHAFLSLIFITKGFSYSDIAMIQAFYSLGVLLFEYPSGVISDKYSRKAVYLLSSFLLLVTYAIVLVSDSVIMLVTAWLVYGVSAAMETGTIDSELVIWIKIGSGSELASDELAGFIGRCRQVSPIAAICGSCFGFVLYGMLGTNVYWVMAALVCLNALVVMLFYRVPNLLQESKARSTRKIVRDSMREVRESKPLCYLVLLTAILQIFIQIHYQLWQAFFLDCGVSESWLISIYLLFQVVELLANRLPVKKVFARNTTVLVLTTVMAALLMCEIDNTLLQTCLYMVIVFVAALVSYFVELSFNDYVCVDNISSITSLISTCMRVLGFVTLIVVSRVLIVLPIRLLLCVVSIVVVAIAVMLSKRLVAMDETRVGAMERC